MGLKTKMGPFFTKTIWSLVDGVPLPSENLLIDSVKEFNLFDIIGDILGVYIEEFFNIVVGYRMDFWLYDGFGEYIGPNFFGGENAPLKHIRDHIFWKFFSKKFNKEWFDGEVEVCWAFVDKMGGYIFFEMVKRHYIFFEMVKRHYIFIMVP